MKGFKVHAISDTHRGHTKLTDSLPGGDLLIHAGDSGCFDERNTETFLKWCILISKRYTFGMVLTGGNHDIHLAEYSDDAKDFLMGSDVRLLINEASKISNYNVFASPCSLAYGDSFVAFAGNEFELKNRAWPKIPNNTDILVTHGPPLGVLDSGYGSASLTKIVDKLQPQLHIFGHIHHRRGIEKKGTTTFINASSVDHLGGVLDPVLVDL